MNVKEALVKEALEVCDGDEGKAMMLLFSESWIPTYKYLSELGRRKNEHQ